MKGYIEKMNSIASSDCDILKIMCDASLRAGHIILAHYTKPFHIEQKADHSPVTSADKASEAIILTLLRKHFADIPVIAEEEVANGVNYALAKQFFLVDPLDGTREFIAHNDEFTVNIALIEDNCPKLGVVFIPTQQKLYVGSPEGAFVYKVEQGKIGAAIPIKTRIMPTVPVAVMSRSHRCSATDQWLDDHNITDRLAVGSSLKFCLIAEGSADIYARFEPCMTWDIAAGDAVLRAAGGILMDGAGNAMQYGLMDTKTVFCHKQSIFFAVGDAKAFTHMAS